MAYIRPKNSKEDVENLFELFKEHKLNISSEDCVMLEDDDGESLTKFMN